LRMAVDSEPVPPMTPQADTPGALEEVGEVGDDSVEPPQPAQASATKATAERAKTAEKHLLCELCELSGCFLAARVFLICSPIDFETSAGVCRPTRGLPRSVPPARSRQRPGLMRRRGPSRDTASQAPRARADRAGRAAPLR